MRPFSMPLASSLAAIAFVGLLAGCGDDNPTKPGNNNSQTQYPTPDSPEHALERLRLTYQNRDSVEYRQLIDFDYLGTSQDLGDGTNVTLFNADEVHHIQALARATTITSIDFTLGTSSSITRQSSDVLAHPEWAVIQISGPQFRLEINDTNRGTMLVNNSSSTYVFRFKPAPQDTTGTDTLWTLIQWGEVVPN